MGYIVFDLEATCNDTWSNEKRQEMETIEIGAVKVDSAFNPTGETFQTFIKPFMNPILTEFCTNLTSITQEQVEGGLHFGTAFLNFLEWADFPNNRFVSWGNYDYHQLDKDCKRANLEMFEKKFHLNGKELYKDYTGRLGHGLGTELKKQKIKFEGTAHRGIDDAIMISRLLRHVYKA